MEDRHESVRVREGKVGEREQTEEDRGRKREVFYILRSQSRVPNFCPYPSILSSNHHHHYHTTPGAPALSLPTLVNKATEG